MPGDASGCWAALCPEKQPAPLCPVAPPVKLLAALLVSLKTFSPFLAASLSFPPTPLSPPSLACLSLPPSHTTFLSCSHSFLPLLHMLILKSPHTPFCPYLPSSLLITEEANPAITSFPPNPAQVPAVLGHVIPFSSLLPLSPQGPTASHSG